MKILCSIIFCFILNICFSQNDTINQKDKEGRKIGYWVYLGKDKPHLKGYNPNDTLEYGLYKNNRKDSTWNKYYPNNIIKLKANYLNNRAFGNFTKYYPTGKVMEVATWKLNKYIDLYTYFYENGCIQTQKFFNENGQAEWTKIFKNNCNSNVSLKGDLIKMDSTGVYKQIIKPDSTYVYNDSLNDPIIKPPISIKPHFKPNGYNKVYNKNKDLWMDGMFKNGKLWEGKKYNYDKDGLLISIEVYKNGKYISNGILSP